MPLPTEPCRPPQRLAPRLALCAALLAGPALGQEDPPRYATRLPVAVSAPAPYYRLSVPLAAYQASAHGDLRDLRIFNAAGQAVPYALLAASGRTEESTQRAPLRWFPLYAPAAGKTAAGDSDLRVVVKQASNGTLVEVNSRRAAPGASGETLRGYVLDASQVADRAQVRALALDWAQPAGQFQLLDVESSDDLQHWTSLASGVQLARLDYGGARIENRSIDLHGLHKRYLRLLWREPAAAPALTRAELELSRSHYESAPLAWSAPLAAIAAPDLEPGEYRFRLAQPLPLARLRIALPPGNQLVPLAILSPAHERRHWGFIASGVAYRITSQGREWSSDEIVLPGYPLREFGLRLDPRLSPLTAAPQLAYALQPAEVVFLASGQPPYTLAVGNPAATNAALPPTTLVPGFGSANSPEIAAAGIAETALPPAAAPAYSTAPPERDWRKLALWSVLLLGVLGMAAMAWQLLRQMKQSRP